MKKWILFLQNNDYIGAKQYINDGANINAVNDTQETILACALRYRCDDDIVELLLQKGADLFACNEDGVSILDYAIMYNHIKLVEEILKTDIDINKTKRPSQFTPLMGAVCYGRKEIAVMLLKKGADVTLRDIKGLSALDFAKKTRKVKMIELLI